jgi:hypothetical protein
MKWIIICNSRMVFKASLRRRLSGKALGRVKASARLEIQCKASDLLLRRRLGRLGHPWSIRMATPWWAAGVGWPEIRKEEAASAAGYGGRSSGRPRDGWMVGDRAVWQRIWVGDGGSGRGGVGGGGARRWWEKGRRRRRPWWLAVRELALMLCLHVAAGGEWWLPECLFDASMHARVMWSVCGLMGQMGH